MSQTGIDQPGGPSSQRCTSAGWVWQAKTRAAGASKTRVQTTSKSFGVVDVEFAGHGRPQPAKARSSAAMSSLPILSIAFMARPAAARSLS